MFSTYRIPKAASPTRKDGDIRTVVNLGKPFRPQMAPPKVGASISSANEYYNDGLPTMLSDLTYPATNELSR